MARVNGSDVTQIKWTFDGKSEKYDVLNNTSVLSGNDVLEIDGNFCSIYENESIFYLWMPLKLDESHKNAEVQFSVLFEKGFEILERLQIETKGKLASFNVII